MPCSRVSWDASRSPRVELLGSTDNRLLPLRCHRGDLRSAHLASASLGSAGSPNGEWALPTTRWNDDAAIVAESSATEGVPLQCHSRTSSTGALASGQLQRSSPS